MNVPGLRAAEEHLHARHPSCRQPAAPKVARASAWVRDSGPKTVAPTAAARRSMPDLPSTPLHTRTAPTNLRPSRPSATAFRTARPHGPTLDPRPCGPDAPDVQHTKLPRRAAVARYDGDFQPGLLVKVGRGGVVSAQRAAWTRSGEPNAPCVGGCVGACVVRAWCVRALVRAGACVRGRVGAWVRGCERACNGACVRVYVRAHSRCCARAPQRAASSLLEGQLGALLEQGQQCELCGVSRGAFLQSHVHS